jgi:hypothetical protein
MRVFDRQSRRFIDSIRPGFTCLSALSFISDDAIVSFAQPLAEALDQLASRPRRADNLIEELGRVEELCIDPAGGSNGRTTQPALHDAHFPDKLPSAHRAENEQIAIEFSNHVDSAAEQTKNAVRWIPLPKQDLPFGEMDRGHCNPTEIEIGSAVDQQNVLALGRRRQRHVEGGKWWEARSSSARQAIAGPWGVMTTVSPRRLVEDLRQMCHHFRGLGLTHSRMSSYRSIRLVEICTRKSRAPSQAAKRTGHQASAKAAAAGRRGAANRARERGWGRSAPEWL